MRLLFMGGSLEPGRDGVGDYARALAAACTRHGHSCALLGWCDPFVSVATGGEAAPENAGLPTLRLPAHLPVGDRLAKALKFRDAFQPDWISLQLVPYALHPRGFLFQAAKPLRAFTAGHRVHLMLHELWVGGGDPATLRHRVTGFLQRLALRRLIDRIKPRLVTTSNPVYVAMLRSIGTDAAILPLFGNLPVAGDDAASISGDDVKEGDAVWTGVFFGSLHPEWKPEPLFGLLLRTARMTGRRLRLVSIGRMGSSGEATWKQLEADYGAEITFRQLGEQPAPAVSRLLQRADFGIAASPWQLIGKSGSAMAMLEHGLPVIVTRNDFRPRIAPGQPPSTDPLLHLCDGSLEDKLRAGLSRREPRSQVDDRALELGRMLEAAMP